MSADHEDVHVPVKKAKPKQTKVVKFWLPPASHDRPASGRTSGTFSVLEPLWRNTVSSWFETKATSCSDPSSRWTEVLQHHLVMVGGLKRPARVQCMLGVDVSTDLKGFCCHHINWQQNTDIHGWSEVRWLRELKTQKESKSENKDVPEHQRSRFKEDGSLILCCHWNECFLQSNYSRN